MRNSQWLAALAACLLTQTALCAETAAEQLRRIEAETAVLKARARKAEVQAQLANKRAEIAARNAEARRVAPPSEEPQLRGIEAIGDTWYATLALPGRSPVDLRLGDKLSDGSRVTAIRPSEVVLQTRAKQVIRLGMSSPNVAGNAPSLALPMELPTPGGLRR